MEGYIFVAHGDLAQLSAHAITFSASTYLGPDGDLYSGFRRHVPGFEELFAALRQQHFVDDVDHDLRRDLVEGLPELFVLGIVLRIDLLALLAQHGNLALLEIALGEDVAVHLDENLFEDLGAGSDGDREEQRCGDGCFLHDSGCRVLKDPAYTSV